MSRTKYFSFAVIAVGIAVVGSLTLAEVMLRLATFRQRRAYPAESNPYFLSAEERRDLWAAGDTGYRFDERLGWIGKPHISRVLWSFGEYKSRVHTNAEGFFDDEIDPRDSRKRIMVLGDSMSFPSGVTNDQAWPNILEKQLFKGSVQVMNMSIGNYGTAQEYLIYNLYGRKYKPRQVILAFQILNDITDNRRSTAPLLAYTHGRLALTQKVPSPAGADARDPNYTWSIRAKDYLADHSLLYNQMKSLKSSAFIFSILKKCHLVTTHLFHEYRVVFSHELPDEFKPDWELTQRIILELKKQVEADGAEFIVVVLSIKEQTDARTWAILQNQYAGTAMMWDRYGINKPLLQFLKDHHIRTLDTGPLVEKETDATGKHFFFPKDRHLNLEGDKLIAGIVYEGLTGKKR